MHVYIYLSFVGALALLFFCIIAVVELTRKGAVTARVWFECTWVGFFFVLELCGAAALTAIGPGVMCDFRVKSHVNDTCTSTRVVLAFSWICALLLLTYFLVLTISALICRKHDPSVWDASVRRYRWHDTCKSLDSTPNSPSLPRFRSQAAPSIKAPQPRRPSPSTLYAHRSGLSPEYNIEHFQPLPERPARAASVSRQMRETTREVAPAPSLYPQHMRSYTPHQPSQPAQARLLPESPPPLGSWPRANVVNEPLRKKRWQAPPSLPLTSHRPPPPDTHSPPSASRPTGPRTSPTQSRNQSRDLRNRVAVPPPLDLSKISTSRPNTAE